MSKAVIAVFILSIFIGTGLVYGAAYTVCGEELTFIAEGEFERVVIKTPGSMMDLGYIYEDGGNFSVYTGYAPRLAMFQVTVYTSENNYFDFVHSVILGSETFEIGGVQITVENNYEPIGTINNFELMLVVLLGLVLGMIVCAVILFILEDVLNINLC